MSCARCPYKMNYELLWTDEQDPEVICVALHCCAGPEIQVRRGKDVLLDELLPTPAAVRERGRQLLEEGFDAASAEPLPISL